MSLTRPSRERPRLPAPGVRSPERAASPGPRPRQPRRGPSVLRCLAPLPLPPPRLRRGPGLGAPQARPRVAGRWRPAMLRLPRLPSPPPRPPLCTPAPPAYPQLFEIRHFTPTAGAAAAAATAPPPVAANDAAAATTAAAASSTILHWAPLKTPRPPPPPPSPPPGPSRDRRESSAPSARGPAHPAPPPTGPATFRRHLPAALPVSALSSRQLPPSPTACPPPACFLVPSLVALPSQLGAVPSLLRAGARPPEAPSQLQRYPRAWKRAWPGGVAEKKRWSGLRTGTFRESAYRALPHGGCGRRKQPQLKPSSRVVVWKRSNYGCWVNYYSDLMMQDWWDLLELLVSSKVVTGLILTLKGS